ncbi:MULTISPECIES: penicillin-binding protein 1C [Myroides]|uniref:peptidoglycan glycosyltransferase n=1 Tax=Myroides albus TaxID=2562892 RepID=A0A6I3LH29_9FLAO|nr:MULTISPECIES: penicillin-binding protein 1C [Myroides]MTG96876.1 penicillin-binding protein 1C [Myroides albus]MVX36500.1 penicillin-binding protein 1C [Myroides sp. LoEW2-1]UVD78374.1 penicillin-binding protein 1C [Myroides albus]
MSKNKFYKISTWSTKKKVKVSIVLLLLIIYYFSLPRQLFDKPYSTVIESQEGKLIGAQIATDGQWRFPETDTIPYKFKMCITHYEDEYFNYHWGINPVSTVKALITNLKAKRVIRGGSTLTQQTIRLARDGQKRSYAEKLIEAIQATRLEFRYSKDKILALYASHAPFGGNVVGLDVAAWRYFGNTPDQLSWAESATLAVLPNAPRLIYPGKNQDILLRKRNALLKKIYDNKIIDKTTYELALIEQLPQKPHDLPQIAPHLLQLVTKTKKEKLTKTTINYDIQVRANEIIASYYHNYKQSEIHNIAAIIIDVDTRQIVSYIGNSPTTFQNKKDVDIIRAQRSTGSILKPFLSGAMLDEAEILPKMLIQDIPIVISGYKPKNYSNTYEGGVPADQALFRSLNIPFVLMLQKYSVYKFHDQLQSFGFKSINKHPNHYGLSLILGGAESSLWEITRAYAGMASTLNYFNSHQGKYRENEIQELQWDKDEMKLDFGKERKESATIGAGAIYSTFKALTLVNRPEGDEAWKHYDSAVKVAWKTGTSFGGRDAWAVGLNKKYIVGVWVGNATGEGRPSISGVRMAGPILFDLFKLLPKATWFDTPLDDLEEEDVCEISGYTAGPNCKAIKQLIPYREKKVEICPYHTLLHLDVTEQYQVNSQCELITNIVSKPWFVLPPIMSYYYKNYHSDYKDPPPFREDCDQSGEKNTIEFIYPKHGDVIYLTKNFLSELQPLIAKAAVNTTDRNIYWYLNEEYIGSTTIFHEMPIQTTPGKHYLTIVNSLGASKTIEIEIALSSDN